MLAPSLHACVLSSSVQNGVKNGSLLSMTTQQLVRAVTHRKPERQSPSELNFSVFSAVLVSSALANSVNPESRMPVAMMESSSRWLTVSACAMLVMPVSSMGLYAIDNDFKEHFLLRPKVKPTAPSTAMLLRDKLRLCNVLLVCNTAPRVVAPLSPILLLLSLSSRSDLFVANPFAS